MAARVAEFGVNGLVRQLHREDVVKTPQSRGFAGGERIDAEGEGRQWIEGDEAEGGAVSGADEGVLRDVPPD